MERLEILEAASTLMSLRRHCDERTHWQQVRSNIYLPHPPVMNPFYNQWPFYKPYPCDVTSGLPIQPHHFPFPYMLGPRPWFPGPQPWLGPIRNNEIANPSIQAPLITLSAVDNSRAQVAMETTDEDQDENEDSPGEQEDNLATSTDKYDQKRKRRNLTKKQQEILEKAYCNTKYPHIEERLKLGKATQLTEDRIQIWFQNRRAKDRRMTDIMKSPSTQASDITNREEIDDLDDKEELGRQFDLLPREKDDEPSPKRLRQE